nr:hypothetical protein [uncultured Mediterraneibacter sp.]
MVFVINKLKYDTDKMDLVSEKCEYRYYAKVINTKMAFYGHDPKLYRTKSERWLLTYRPSDGSCTTTGVALDEKEVKKLLLRYDWQKYEKIFWRTGGSLDDFDFNKRSIIRRWGYFDVYI